MTKILLPSYIWAGDNAEWEKVYAYSKPGIAIINPNSGPGDAIDQTVLSRVIALQDLGWEVVGYVSTNYLKRSILDITRDVTIYRYYYPIRGIFYDEIPGPSTGVIESLLMFQGMATRLGGSCVFNPGVPVDDLWFRVLDKSIIITYEGSARTYTDKVVRGTREAHIIYAADGPINLRTEYGYVTNDTLPNPYDTFSPM